MMLMLKLAYNRCSIVVSWPEINPVLVTVNCKNYVQGKSSVMNFIKVGNEKFKDKVITGEP